LVVDVLLHEDPRDEGEDEVVRRGVRGRSRKMDGEKGSGSAKRPSPSGAAAAICW
jgi:hypothetical protein